MFRSGKKDKPQRLLAMTKTKTTITATPSSPKSCPSNPWTGITWADTVASCDKGIITSAYCSAKGIDIDCLPEPFSGNIDSPVVCLNGNPGPADKCFHGDPTFEKLTINTLKHSKTGGRLWDTPLEKSGKLHDGYLWFQERTKELRSAICPKDLNLFMLEFFPYHTVKSFNFPSLPSDEYRNYLLCQAMKEGKLIVMLRGRSRWFAIKDTCCDGEKIGEKLSNYPNLIFHRNPRSVYISERNFEPSDWEKLVNALK